MIYLFVYRMVVEKNAQAVVWICFVIFVAAVAVVSEWETSCSKNASAPLSAHINVIMYEQ